MENLIIKTGFENMDTSAVVKLLQSTYWADDRSAQTIVLSMQNAVCFGVFDTTVQKQVGFCRVITDYATTYYLCDVVVDPLYRGEKIGSMLMAYVTGQTPYCDLRGILGTKDAHAFYEKFGFEKIEKLFMQRWAKKFVD